MDYMNNFENIPYYIHDSNKIIKIEPQEGGYKKITKIEMPKPRSQQESILEIPKPKSHQESHQVPPRDSIFELPKPKSHRELQQELQQDPPQELILEMPKPKNIFKDLIEKITDIELKNEIETQVNILESYDLYIYADDNINSYNKATNFFTIVTKILFYLIDMLEYKISHKNCYDSRLCKDISKFITNDIFYENIDNKNYYSLEKILSNNEYIKQIANYAVNIKKNNLVNDVISKSSSIDELEQLFKKCINYAINNHKKTAEEVFCIFVMFTLIEEYLNNNVGSNPILMIFMFDIFNFYIVMKNKRIIDSDIFIKILLEFSLYFHFFEEKNIRKYKYEIYNINSESHSMKLILHENEKEKGKYHCIFINSGKGIENNDNKIFLVRQTTQIDDIYLLIKKSYNYTIKEIYDKIISATENDDIINQNIIKFESKYCSKQLSGSCTYYSSLYSLYYIFFDNFSEDQVEDIINFYNNSLKELVLDLLVQGTYNSIIKISNPEIQIIFNNCLSVIDNKYNLNNKYNVNTKKIDISPAIITKIDNIKYNQNNLKLLSQINDPNILISSINTLHHYNDEQDIINYESMLKTINQDDKIDVIPFLLYLTFTISKSNSLYYDIKTKDSVLTILNFYENLNFDIDILNIDKFIFLILRLLFRPFHGQYEINNIMYGYIFLILFNTFEHLEHKYDKLFLLEKTEAPLFERNKITSNMVNFFFPTNKLYIDATRLFNKYNNLINDLIQGDNLKFNNITNYDYDIIICKLFNKKYYNVAAHVIDLTIENADDINLIPGLFDDKVFFLNTNNDIINNSYFFKKNVFYLFKRDEFDNFNNQNFNIKTMNKQSLLNFVKKSLDVNNNMNNNINLYNPQLIHLNNHQSKSIINESINHDFYNDNQINKEQIKEQNWINPFKLKTSDINDDEKFNYILNNINYLFLPKVIENDDYNENFYSNYINDENNFYATNKQIFITNFNNLNFNNMLEEQIMNEKTLFIIYFYYLFFEIKGIEITNSNNYNVMIKKLKKYCDNNIFYSILFESQESIKPNVINKYVGEILKIENHINFADYIILHQKISKLYHQFKGYDDLKLLINDIVLSNIPEYDYIYTYKNEKYGTTYKINNEFHIESGLKKYIKFIKISDKTDHYLSGLYPRLIKINSDYFLYNKPEYIYDKNLVKISLGNKKSIYGFKNTKYENNYIYYYSNCKNDEQIYYETIIDDKVYIFDNIIKIDSYSPYLDNYEKVIDSDKESVNSLIVTNKKLYFFINKKDKNNTDYEFKYKHIFGIDNSVFIKKINDKINNLSEKNNYRNENLFFEYDIIIDENNKIIDIDFDSELSALILFLILNRNFCYELIMNLMNRFVSKLEIIDFCLYINHPYSYIFAYKLLNYCCGFDILTYWFHDGLNLYQIENGNKKIYKKSNNCKELLGILDTDFSDEFCTEIIDCITNHPENIKSCYENYLSEYIEYLVSIIKSKNGEQIIKKIDPYIMEQLLEVFNFDINIDFYYWNNNFINDDNDIPDGWDLSFKTLIKNNDNIKFFIQILYFHYSSNLKKIIDKNNDIPLYKLIININNFNDHSNYNDKIFNFIKNHEKFIMVFQRRINDENQFNSKKIFISQKNIDKTEFDEYYISVDNLKYKDKQKQIIDEINNYISDPKNSSNPMYEIMMGFGKSKVIIPYITLYTFLCNNQYNQIVIIVPKNLVNEMYNNILYRTKHMPLCIVKKQDEYENENNNYILEKYAKVIVIISDATLKYQLLIQSKETSNNQKPKQFLFDHYYSRFFIIDEIDDCINPLKSNFNLKIQESTMKKEIPEYCDLFFSFMIDYIKKISSVSNCDNVNEIIKDFFSDHIDVLECICQNKNHNNLIKDSCKGIINDDEKAKILYIMEKIYNATKILTKYIKNRHYGFDKIKNKKYFYAIPYIAIDTPSSDSEFNDIYTIMILTINLYLDNDFSLRDEDIKKITSFLVYSDIDIPSEKIEIINLCHEYNNIDNERSYKNNVLFKNKINELGFSNYLIELYLSKIILPNINFTIEYKNTSFLELLNPQIVNKYISFSGTTEFVGKINNEQNELEYPKINNKQIASYNNKYSTRIEEYQKIKAKFFKKINYANLNENSIYNYINDNNSKKNAEKINCVIDTGCIFRFKQNQIYAQEILSKIKGIDYVLFYDNNDILYRCSLINKEYTFTLENTIKNSRELETMSKENYFVFFDEKHVRGSDINLPLNTHGIVTVTHINNSVNIMQGIYRLRQIGKGQTIEFIINKNLENIVDKIGLWDYIENNTNIYMKEQEKDLIIQTILANQKFMIHGYINIKIIPDFLPNDIYKRDINDIMKFDFNTKKILDYYINPDVLDGNIKHYHNLILKYIKNKKFDDSTSISLGLSLGIGHSIDVNISKYIRINTSEKYKMNTKIQTNNDWLEIYDYKQNKHTYFSFYSYAYLNNEIKKFYEENGILDKVINMKSNHKRKFKKYQKKIHELQKL
jgi:hypothetical protein